MCGVPYHAAATYIAKLIDKGYKVAVCEQMTGFIIFEGDGGTLRTIAVTQKLKVDALSV
uniref:hypothetical protein n=1 Tax=Cloacibacillus evryensis TaxID=508460 RepID=UPI003AB3A03A